MAYLPLITNNRTFLTIYDVHIARLLNTEQLSEYNGLTEEGRIVVSHRLRNGDTFDRAMELLHLLAEDKFRKESSW